MAVLRRFFLCLILVLTGCPQAPVAMNSADGQTLTGQVIGLDGKPARDVLVKGYLISNNSAGLTNSTPLVSNNGAGLTNSTPLVSNITGGYRIQSARLETRTDADGRFRLTSEGMLNVEAILSDDVKAIRLNVSAGYALTLQLAYTGSISGRVTAPDAPTVNDFTGVDVYIPGTSYLAKTDAAGRYTLSNIAVGSFTLVASKTGLGTGSLSGVKVDSRTNTMAPDLALSLKAPRIVQITPPNAAPGATVTVSGANFGASTGETLLVSFNGTPATHVDRIDNQTLKAIVPEGATSGNLVVAVGGILSNAQPFTVLETLTLNPGNMRLKLGESIACYVLATDTSGEVVTNPHVTWNVQGSAIKLTGGTVSAEAVGTASLRISSGALSSIRTFQVLQNHPRVTTFAGSVGGYLDGIGTSAQLYPYSLILDPGGNLLVADRLNYRIRRITPEGEVTTFAGSGVEGSADGPLLSAQFRSPARLAFHPNGDLFLVELHDVVRRISSGSVMTFAGTGTSGYEDGFPAQFSSPDGLAIDAQGNLFISDTENNCIRKIRADGQASTVAGSLNPGFMDGFASTARFNSPKGLAFDSRGNLYVADMGNHAIRKMTPDGLVVTVAGNGRYGYFDGNGKEAQFNTPLDVAVGADGRIYVADFQNHRIRIISPAGAVSTLAGRGVKGKVDGEAPLAQFYYPGGVAVAPDGTVYVSDNGNDVIRRIQP